MTLEIIFHEILCKFTSVTEALQATVHVACIAKIFKPNNSFSASKIFFLKVKFLESDRPSPNVFLLKFTFCLMVFPVFLEAFH